MTAGDRNPHMVGVAKYVVKAYPDADDNKHSLAPTVRALKLGAAAEQMLHHYVKELLTIRTASRAAAARALVEAARQEGTLELERTKSLDLTAVRDLAASLAASSSCSRGLAAHQSIPAAHGPTAYEQLVARVIWVVFYASWTSPTQITLATSCSLPAIQLSF